MGGKRIRLRLRRRMLKAGVFNDFMGATTLLLWGDLDGMATLLDGLSGLRDRDCDELEIDGPHGSLTVRACDEPEVSTLEMAESGFLWGCSRDTVDSAAGLVEPLLHSAGHQFLDVAGLAEQVMIARDEYPADLS